MAAQKQQEGQARRERLAQRSRDATAAVSEIGAIPKRKNRRRWGACRLDLHRFLTTYFPHSTGLSPFSVDHDSVIARIESCILGGGRFVNAVYRGFAKTTIAENASLWAVLYGHRSFVPIFTADSGAADGMIDSLKVELYENDLLCEDFPEACFPIRALEWKPQRCLSQTHKGKLTHISWTSDRIILPTITGSVSSGAIIAARGITAGIRGLKHKRPDGRQQRPDFVIGDDIQTEESAATPFQVQKTLNIIRKAIVKLSGHQRSLAIVLNATVLAPDDAIDQLLDPVKSAAWDGVRIGMVKQWATNHQLWMDDYARIRRTYDKSVVGDQKRAHREATEFYAAHREEMDAGCIVSWEHCYDHESELSAIQHAYNALIDDGEESFASEYQNQPLALVQSDLTELTSDQIAARTNAHARLLCPSGTTRVTAMIDVQGSLLYYTVCAWDDRFTGAVVDYGAWPDQRRLYYTLRDATPTLADAYPGIGLEAQIFAGLGALTARLLGSEWRMDDGTGLRIERCLIDANWGDSSEVVYKFCRESPYSAVLTPSHGKYVGAASQPVTARQKKPGERFGLNWVVAVGQRRSIRHVVFDTNFWKSFLASRLSTAPGGPGALSLFGDSPTNHRLFADHLTAEYRVKTEGRGRTVDEWKLRPGRPDNHFLDTTVGACVAASMQGAVLDDVHVGTKQRPKAPPVALGEMQQRARQQAESQAPKQRMSLSEMQERAREGRR